MKPVEIEFLMHDNLTAGLDKSKMSVEQLLGAARRASAEINHKIEEQRKVIDTVNDDLGKMERKLQTMKPGAGQQELLVEINACKKVLAEEVTVLNQLETEHQQAKQGVAQLEQEYSKLHNSEKNAVAESKSLTEKIAEQKEVVKHVEADVRALQKAYEKATPGQAQNKALAELNAAKKALEEDKAILAALTEEQEKNKESNRRLAIQLRDLEHSMQRMRLEGKQDSEEYREMAQKAAMLADTLKDVKNQTSILSNDDANLQGFISGINGLSGAFTTATGVMSLFASENENLQKVQARLQSVMAITMGLQQVFNTLNKDSAFRLVTVAKAKNLLTAANHRLAAALGISNAAASALMATLTLGLSVVITGLIVAWNKYSDAQEEAKKKTEELIEVESQGRAEMIKTRFEIDTTRESLKNFNGSKEEEKQKCEELNRKYGEAFGYYDTVAQWYDVLTAKAEQYIQMLFLQAKAQALVNKAVEADDKLNKHKATKPEDAETSMGWFTKSLYYFAQAESKGRFNAKEAIDEINREAYDKETKRLEAERDKSLKEAADLQKQAAEIAKGAGIGGHSKPDNKDAKKEEERKTTELAALRQKNIQSEVDVLKEGSEKKRQQLKVNYEKEIAELATQEKKWRDAQKGELTQGQTDALKAARDLAAKKREQGEEDINKEENKKELERHKAEITAMVDYLKEYGSFQQQKLAIAEEYAQKIAEVEISEADEATKQWQKKKLNKERLQKEANLSFENISRGIDWHALFSGVGNLTKEMMIPMMEQLQAFVKTDDYRKADAETQQKVTELILEMRKYLGSDQSVTWKTLDKAIKDFTASVARYDTAKKREDEAVRARDEGKKRLAAGKITAEEYKNLERIAQECGDVTVQTREDMEMFGEQLNLASEEVANYTSGLSTALANAKGWQGVEGFGNVENAAHNIDQWKKTLDEILPKMGENMGDMMSERMAAGMGVEIEGMGESMAQTIGSNLSGTVGGLMNSIGGSLGGILESGMGSMIGIIAQIPKLILDIVHAIKNFVTGILDALTELVSLRWIDDLIVGILDAIGNLIDTILDLPENIYHVLEAIIVKGIGGLLNGVIGRLGNILTLGALSSKGPADWFSSSNADEVNRRIDRLTERSEMLEQSIDDLTDEMKTARGKSAIDMAQRAKELQEDRNYTLKAIAQEQAGYHGDHHSFNYYWGGYEDWQIEDFSKQIGRDWDGDLWNLSPEEMKLLRSNPDMWKQIQDTGKGNYGGRVAEKLDEYIDQAGKLEEITNALNEALTTTTKENVFDDFLNSLYDLADGSEDVMDAIADNWQKMVNRMAVNNIVGEQFKKKLDGWYEELAEVNEKKAKGEISDEEYRTRLDALKTQYEGWVDSGKRDIETLRSVGIIKETEENKGTTQSGKAGAFTTMSQDQAGKLEGLFVSGQIHWASIDDKMTDVSVQIGAAGDTLKRIEEHTGSSALSLEEIKNDIKIIKRDGLKVN